MVKTTYIVENQQTTVIFSANYTKVPPKPKPLLPWLKKWNSEDEAAPEKPKVASKLPKIEESKYKTIDRFSELFNKSDLLKPISLQKHTDTMLGTVEKAVMGVALAHRVRKMAFYIKNPRKS